MRWNRQKFAKNNVTEFFIKRNPNYLSEEYQISRISKNRTVNRNFKNSEVQKEYNQSISFANSIIIGKSFIQTNLLPRHLLEIGISFCQHGICFFQSEILHSFNFPKRNFFSYFMLPKIWKICVYEPISKFFWDLIPP